MYIKIFVSHIKSDRRRCNELMTFVLTSEDVVARVLLIHLIRRSST